MTDNDNTYTLDTSGKPNPKLTELAERLTGKWQVKGPEIDDQAEFRAMKNGFLLVGNVDFVVNGAKMTNIQHITYDQNTDTLRSRYMDTMGDYSCGGDLTHLPVNVLVKQLESKRDASRQKSVHWQPAAPMMRQAPCVP